MRGIIIETIQSAINEFANSNQCKTYWKEPIIAVISARDENVPSLKETVSPEHFMPSDISPDAKSIISFFIPFHEDIINSKINGKMASKEWALAYIKTNALIQIINDNIESIMERNGYKAGKIPATHNFDEKKLISNWSHRHIAYIAGIGTFGINNMLITEKGCCGRFGSIITDYEFKNYAQMNNNEKCLHKINGSCGLCRKKCAINAYENNNFNRHKCYAQCLENAHYHINIGYADICGKCMVGLPCSLAEPAMANQGR